MYFLTKSLPFCLPVKTRPSDMGVKTCYLKEAKKQPASLPFWLETQHDQKDCQSPRPSPLLPVCLSIHLPGPMADSCQLVAGSDHPHSRLILLTHSQVHSTIEYPRTLCFTGFLFMSNRKQSIFLLRSFNKHVVQVST